MSKRSFPGRVLTHRYQFPPIPFDALPDKQLVKKQEKKKKREFDPNAEKNGTRALRWILLIIVVFMIAFAVCASH